MGLFHCTVRVGSVDAKTSYCKRMAISLLRFLPEELAKELDSVFDGILRSLSFRRKPDRMAIPITVVRGSGA
jgi:hypothetical protein